MFRANEESRVTVKVRVEWDGDSWIARCTPFGREVIAAVSGEYDGCSGQDPEPNLDALERAALQEMSDSLRRRDYEMDELRLVAEIDAESGERAAMAPSPEPFLATCHGDGDPETCPCRACHSERCARAGAEAY